MDNATHLQEPQRAENSIRSLLNNLVMAFETVSPQNLLSTNNHLCNDNIVFSLSLLETISHFLSQAIISWSKAQSGEINNVPSEIQEFGKSLISSIEQIIGVKQASTPSHGQEKSSHVNLSLLSVVRELNDMKKQA